MKKFEELLSVPGLHLRAQDDRGVCVYWVTHVNDVRMTIENVRTGEVRIVPLNGIGATVYELLVVSSRFVRVLLQE